MIDSGCTNHMTGDSKLLYDFMEAIQPFMSIMFGGGSKGQVLGLGKVAMASPASPYRHEKSSRSLKGESHPWTNQCLF